MRKVRDLFAIAALVAVLVVSPSPAWANEAPPLSLLVPRDRIERVEEGIVTWTRMGYDITVIGEGQSPCVPTGRAGFVRICGAELERMRESLGFVPCGLWTPFEPAGLIEIDPACRWNRRVICHEVGHTLGRPHDADPKSCMRSTS